MEKNNQIINQNDIKEYNIEAIIEKCEKMEKKKEFIDYITSLLKEKNNQFLYVLYKLYSKKLIIKILEKTLKTINEGGIKKINCEQNRTIGGTFIYYIKINDNINKDDLKKIFWRKTKGRKEKKKLCKKMNKLVLNNK